MHHTLGLVCVAVLVVILIVMVIAPRLERITDHDRNLIRHFVGRARGNEHVDRIARPVGRTGLGRTRPGEHEADFLAAG